MTFTLDNTVAVVVGIEDYEISKGLDREARWDLDGPASDAVRFVRWLKSQRVPAKNIHVFLSALNTAAHESELARLGITNLSDAKQKTLEDFFWGELRGLAPNHDGQFVMLWGGHGILRAFEERHLYCADVLPYTMRTIWLNDLLRLLREMTGFNRQYIFVDACANAHEDTGLNRPSHHAPGNDRPPSGVEQYALLAASAGQLAVNRRDLHAGLFSTYLFETLESSPQWPLFERLEEGVLARFEKKFAEDATFNQRPVSLTVVDHTNRKRDLSYGGIPVPQSLQALAETTGYSVAALQKLTLAAKRCDTLRKSDNRAHFYRKFEFPEPSFRADDDYDLLNLLGRVLLAEQTRPFLKELRAREPHVAAYAELEIAFQQASLVRTARLALLGLHISTSEYRGIFSLVQTGFEPASLEDILEILAARGSIRSCGLFEFLFRVANCSGCADPRPLLAWVKENAEAQHYADLEKRWNDSRSYAALVSIKPSVGKNEIPQSFTVWLLENGRATGRMWTESFDSCDDIQALRQELMQRLETTLEQAVEAGDGPLFIEIAIPMRLMRWRFDQLGIRHANSKFKRLLGRDHPVVVRWRDRQKQNAMWSNSWRKASAFIRSRSVAAAPTWLPLPDDPDEAFLRTLEKPPAEFLFLGAPEPPLEEDDPDWLQEVIIAGIPFGGWMVHPAPHPDKVPGLLDKLLQGEFEQLPLRVPDMRRDEHCTDLHPLIVLWDDPDRRHTVLLEEPA